jgi:glycolate oxidase
VPIDQSLADQVRAIVGRDNYLDGPADTASYGFNSYPMFTEPGAVVLFETKEQIQRVVPLLYQNDVPVVIRGSGTNVVGNALAPKGGVILSLERMTRVLEVDPVSRFARVEAGAIVKQLQLLAQEHGLLFPPNPGNVDAITVGGIIGCNSSGDLALGYGTTRDFVLGLEMVGHDGSLIRLGSACRKDVTGYDVIRLVIGAEGTLGVVVEVTLRFLDRPEAESSVLAAFSDERTGAEAALRVMGARLRPVALEYMDRVTTEAVERAFQIGIPPGSASVLLAKFHGNRESVDANARRCGELLREIGATFVSEAFAGQPADHLWRARHLAYPALARICPTLYGEDIVVPLARFPEALARFQALSAETGVPIAMFAHAGDGHVHPILLTDDSDPAQRERSDRFVEGVIRTAIELGGTITGEHGLGVHKSRYILHQYSEPTLDLMKRVKRAFDPKGLFNPMIFPIVGPVPPPRAPRRRSVHVL